ncbi:MAG: enoyl-CoA hydratase-related protein [Syntrophomonadaceae bacterium]|nr:enoyl-CoA hydratase-related protein [Syntrophomonadaceae bacterium]MDD3022912.1 enoyl-CoA hydratase-related protein [Syntrophomonadaceae bacterium]
MELNTLLFEKEAGIGIITLNRPASMNGINDEMMMELSALMDEIAVDEEIRALILTGGQKVFAAGGDIGYIAKLNTLEAEAFVALVHKAINKIAYLEKPVVAAISGLALGGGCELALCCDIRIAAEGSKFGLPEINLGIMPGAGAGQRLPRIVGMGWAKHLILTGSVIDAEAALRIGLVTKVVPAGDLMEEARKIAGSFVPKSPVALRTAKNCLNYGENVDLPSGLVFEQKMWSFLFSTEDQKEGMNAFIEKRKPEFKGK